MEQVADNHGDGIRDIYVTCVDDLKEPDVHPPNTFQEFYDFPELCGWQVKEDFTLMPYDQGEQYHNAPAKQVNQLSKPFLIQAWLFFGLIQTLVQIDNKPILTFNDLHASGQLSTAKLHDAIKKWTDWEAKNKKGQRFRLIQVGWVLDQARQVIRKEFAYRPGEDDADDDLNDTLDGYGNQAQVHPGDKMILVIMCLGETLAAAKARILEQNQIDTTGWHSDDQAGWGPPKHVFTMMEKAKWCPRTMEILRGQVSSNATMLIAAYQAYHASDRMKGGHIEAGCTAQECKLKSLDEKGKYENRHRPNCRRRNCEPFGPEGETVLELLRRDKNIIPLLRLKGCDDPGGPQFEVIPFDPKDEDDTMDFVTISHVWSDGWGNEQENKLNRCQLSFIRSQIKRATGSENTPFWMDTLVIPVAKGEEECRKRGIRQIFDVFSSSSHTIILDNGLSDMDQGKTGRPAEAAMKIFASIWMRRLWTLQEAYLSNKLLIPFMEENRATNNLVDFDVLEQELELFMKKSTSGITQIIKVQLSHTIMGEERRLRKNRMTGKGRHEKLLKEKTAAVVANAYRAARWRTTAKPEHEVLALATLLKLETQGTQIEEAGLDPPGKTTNAFSNDRLEDLVCVFWTVLHRQRKGAIPSGMIFLPGDKVNRKGFGWAPRTWLSAYEMDYPDPLSSWIKPTDLSPEKGLSVYYPGFLLHPDSTSCRGKILGTSADSEPFTFPVDRSLNEWYSFQRLDDTATGPLNEVTRQVKANTQLAIILSGSALPRESPREISLLVEVIDFEADQTSEETLDRRAVEYRCHIIHRILVWRSPDHLRGTRDKRSFKSGSPGAGLDEDICIGEVTNTNQRWWVDRPEIIKTVKLPSEKNEQEEEFTPKPIKRAETTLDKIVNVFSGVWTKRKV
ncbi:hypothetical protein QBC37DRAFT_449855 [Rhypophila decipiens]|uniref:Heterokaryon incompatibility domain-containing protein n=1 Tax=Rhypophila decipiens TaxID=261697 RepID=A0AAN6Y1L2_9PEZI|nr:hypothetical protein QBC37DRAFT_449855 [Rhypophila decipiens]